ncbi:MAG: DUF3027 domain-containing protein [Actinomycetaceae bacterium]|nr:DUF3027 domain-containing protein [Arcanobacterium sp.]MDD7504879.1 DUF3027 domain-containing protein [Actinomycetaceae bacterium]MDY6142715.1 DUF3027 domain-containing protein [Arcanobacterium sp.]
MREGGAGESERRISPKERIGREKILAGAIDVAREALREVTPERNVGEHVGMIQEAERVLTHAFECLMPGYKGWFWTVTLARAPRSQRATVDEVSLRPGSEALLAPAWVPWAERLQPSDVAASDRLPYDANDANLEGNTDSGSELEEAVKQDPDFDPDLKQGFEASGVDADAMAQWELGLGRKRVLSEGGRTRAFRRWYRSDAGPRNQATREAGAQCSTCGYFMRMGGSARVLFGACANEWSPFDGRVVSVDHGCGSHSETDVKYKQKLWDPSAPVINESDIDELDVNDSHIERADSKM